MKNLSLLCLFLLGGIASADPRPYYFNRGLRLKSLSGAGGWVSGDAGIWNKAGVITLRTAAGTDVNLESGGGLSSVTADSPLGGSGTSGSHLTCSTCVTLAGTQELTNKTLTSMVVKTGLTASGSSAIDFSGNTGTWKPPTGGLNAALVSASGAALTFTSTETSGDGSAFIFNNSNSYTNNEFTVAFRNAGNDYFKLFPLGGSGTLLRAFSSSDGSALSDQVWGSTTMQLRGPGGAGIGVNPGSDVVSTLGVSGTRWLAAWTRYTVVGDASGNKPTCNSTNRGAIFLTQAAGGASDTLEVCAKAAADTYAWGTVFTAP